MVREEYPNATIVRPAEMFGPEDTLLNKITARIKMLGGIFLINPDAVRYPVYVCRMSSVIFFPCLPHYALLRVPAAPYFNSCFLFFGVFLCLLLDVGAGRFCGYTDALAALSEIVLRIVALSAENHPAVLTDRLPWVHYAHQPTPPRRRMWAAALLRAFMTSVRQATPTSSSGMWVARVLGPQARARGHG